MRKKTVKDNFPTDILINFLQAQKLFWEKLSLREGGLNVLS